MLVLGDPFEDKMLFERPGRRCQRRLPQFVDMPADRVVVKAAAAKK
jgi:hypothetical protein